MSYRHLVARAGAIILVWAGTTVLAAAGEGTEAMSPYGLAAMDDSYLDALNMPAGGRIKSVRPAADMRTPELLLLLRHWSPVVRLQAATALAEKHKADVLPLVAPLLEESTWHVNRAALDALSRTMALWKHRRGHFIGKSEEEQEASERAHADFTRRLAGELPRIVALLRHRHFWLRCGAAEVLGGMGSDAKGAARDLLAAMRDPDPWVGERAANALRKVGIEGLDPAILVSELRRTLRHYRSRARGAAIAMMAGLDVAILRKLVPDLSYSVSNPAYDRMFANGPRFDATMLLIKIGAMSEAAVACGELIDDPLWGKAHRRQRCAKIVEQLGPDAAKALPALRRALADERALNRAGPVEALSGAIESITGKRPD